MNISRRLILSLPAIACLPRPGAAEDAPIIAAASDLQFAMTEIAAAFTAATGKEVNISYGSTGNFARQIREGAPYQMFLAADEAFVLALAQDGLTLDQGDRYAEGRVVIVAPKGSDLGKDGMLETLRQALHDGNINRFAIANPDHAPYGQRAEEALRHAGLWDAINPFLILGENVSQAAQFALSGNAEGGIIAYSLALAPALSGISEHALIPADWHAPLHQRMVLLPNAGKTARALYSYLQSPEARAVLARYGFVLPGD